MTKDQIEQKIAELHEKMFSLQKEIEEVEREAVKMKDVEEWPIEGSSNFFLSAEGTIWHGAWDNETGEKLRLAIGNCFRTEANAKFAVERLKVLAEMRKFAFKPDWNDAEQQKFMLQYGIGESITIEFEDQFCDFYGPWFATRDDAQQCLDAIGEERLKKYYFGVKDDE